MPVFIIQSAEFRQYSTHLDPSITNANIRLHCTLLRKWKRTHIFRLTKSTRPHQYIRINTSWSITHRRRSPLIPLCLRTGHVKSSRSPPTRWSPRHSVAPYKCASAKCCGFPATVLISVQTRLGRNHQESKIFYLSSRRQNAASNTLRSFTDKTTYDREVHCLPASS